MIDLEHFTSEVLVGKRLPPSRLPELQKLLQKEPVYSGMLRAKAISPEDVADYVAKGWLTALELSLPGQSKRLGYGFLVHKMSGTPFVFYYSDEGHELACEGWRELILACAHAYHRYLKTAPPYEYDYMVHFLPKPPPEELEMLITELGFDLQESWPTIDNETTAAYKLEKATYAAYYAEVDTDSGAP